MHKKMFLKSLAAAALLASVGLPAAAWAQTYPTRPVRIVVPQTPGGASDALARIVGQKLAEKWGQPVVIENRAGAGGNVGMEAVLAAPADGYTLLMTYVGTQAINGALYKNLPFDPGRDFVPVATLATVPFVVVAKAGTPFTTAGALADAARSGRVTYGSAGNGSVNHLLGEMFARAAKVELVHVPYRGAAPALQDLLGGQIDVVFTSLPSVAGQIKTAALQPIAVTSAKRAPAFASIPTVAESGLPGFDVNPWFGLMAHKNIPRELVERINADVNALLRQPEMVERFAAQGAEPYATSQSEFTAILAADIEKWGAVVRASGAKVD
ncbi:Bug family tripartite tricarboxylate transporter substrate binding protein [Pseudorhodoferax sp.]|uniref:Bug family tripartite tricarboxylate transporter substrate binding protein n=1 Tax=Pseudorhodoferax sp. TaxID=1993553 RepID=UPI002DD651F0|nr:tripartite tricarboxylate transporter substrate binding protein [Pseudorhodoferax sp.]